MKNKIFLGFIFLLSICLIGCKNEDNQPVDNQLDIKFATIEQYINNNIPYLVCEDINLIQEYEEYNAVIEWDSSNLDLIDFDGYVTPNRSKAEVVTLTYTINISDETKKGEIEIVISPTSVDKIIERFESQFSKEINRDFSIKTKFYDLFEFEWTSSNESVFDNNGKYYKPNKDTEIEIYYKLKCNNKSIEEKKLQLLVLGPSDMERVEEINKWLKTEGLQDCYLNSKSVLPMKYEPYNIEINWSSTNNDVVSSDGVITQYVYERYVTLFAKYTLENGSGGTCKFECIIEPLDISKMKQSEIIENFIKSIAVTSYDGVIFKGNGSGCNKTFGHLNFYENKESEIVKMLCPTTNANRTGIQTDVKFIVCHDTGNMSSSATAKANANYCINSGVTSETGWHYTVGNDGIYQTVPEGEVAYHAHGGAQAYAEFIKTNVKAIWKKPNISLSDDGYIMFNNIKSDYLVPNPKFSLVSDGPIYQIGDDGYYYISRLWEYSGHAVNAVRGGNANSIGIESAVNSSTDYLLTCRIFAKLVAEIAIRHNVDMIRIVQHNTTSGKDCPNAMRVTDFWYTFKDIVSMEIFAKTFLNSYTFEWNGISDITNDGRIALDIQTNEVKYSVVVKEDNNIVFNKNYVTKINKK